MNDPDLELKLLVIVVPLVSAFIIAYWLLAVLPALQAINDTAARRGGWAVVVEGDVLTENSIVSASEAILQAMIDITRMYERGDLNEEQCRLYPIIIAELRKAWVRALDEESDHVGRLSA